MEALHLGDAERQIESLHLGWAAAALAAAVELARAAMAVAVAAHTAPPRG